jgi:hypothetical protein
MLSDQHGPEDVFARVPELADQIDLALVALDRPLEGDTLYQQLHADVVRRSRLTPACPPARVSGRVQGFEQGPFTIVEVTEIVTKGHETSWWLRNDEREPPTLSAFHPSCTPLKKTCTSE